MRIEELIEEGKLFRISKGENGYSVNDPNGYIKWQEKCKRFLNQNYPNDVCVADFENNCKAYPNSTSHIRLIGCLEAICCMPEIIPIRNPNEKSTPDSIVNVHLNQKQEQTQSQELAINIFMESIKEELTGKQLDEIKAIVTEEPESQKAKIKVVDKLKSVGENTLTNIVANILTNPAIWGGLL